MAGARRDGVAADRALRAGAVSLQWRDPERPERNAAAMDALQRRGCGTTWCRRARRPRGKDLHPAALRSRRESADGRIDYGAPAIAPRAAHRSRLDERRDAR